MIQALRNLIAETFVLVLKVIALSFKVMTQSLVLPNFKTAIANSTGLERWQQINQQALDLFEDPAESQRWLATPKHALNGKTPLESLKTEKGTKQVEALLYRAEYGIWG
jgi:putative toxin-antitoxin system antitoxin component (TIGR02293 family)